MSIHFTGDLEIDNYLEMPKLTRYYSHMAELVQTGATITEINTASQGLLCTLDEQFSPYHQPIIKPVLYHYNSLDGIQDLVVFEHNDSTGRMLVIRDCGECAQVQTMSSFIKEKELDMSKDVFQYVGEN